MPQDSRIAVNDEKNTRRKPALGSQDSKERKKWENNERKEFPKVNQVN